MSGSRKSCGLFCVLSINVQDRWGPGRQGRGRSHRLHLIYSANPPNADGTPGSRADSRTQWLLSGAGPHFLKDDALQSLTFDYELKFALRVFQVCNVRTSAIAVSGILKSVDSEKWLGSKWYSLIRIFVFVVLPRAHFVFFSSKQFTHSSTFINWK